MTYHDARNELLQHKSKLPWMGMAIEAVVMIGVAGILVQLIA